MKILILGASGMLGHSLFRLLRESGDYVVRGTLRTDVDDIKISALKNDNLYYNVNAFQLDTFEKCISDYKPHVVINCIGAIKQLHVALDTMEYLNSSFPHALKKLADKYHFRLIHFSTDCVFSGSAGSYTEKDLADAEDCYGKSKFRGEINAAGCLTLRTSIIGHELVSNVSLVDWFLEQRGTVRGYSRAFFSGFPTVYIAEIIKMILAREELSGLYHLASETISKFDLLHLIKSEYGVDTMIVEDPSVEVNRSLNGNRLNMELGLAPPNWIDLVTLMRQDYLKYESVLYNP
jgi:dTDP-4-dehydrorhamnose reductase